MRLVLPLLMLFPVSDSFYYIRKEKKKKKLGAVVIDYSD